MKKTLLFTFIAALSFYNFLLGKQDADRAANQASTLTLSTIALSATETETVKRIRFLYDFSGNRISRYALGDDAPFMSPTPVNTDTLSVPKENNDQAPELDIRKATVNLFPNPTSGPFYLTISNLPKDAKCELFLLDTQGKIIDIKQSIPEQQIPFDLSGKAVGIYYLKIVLGKTESSFKIIKN